MLAKPVGPSCDLDCRYCFYSDKGVLLSEVKRAVMADDVLEVFVAKYIQSQDVPEVQFVWQGGEPTLAGLDFYSRVVSLQARYAGGKKIRNALQTNGTQLNDQWCGFLKEHEFLVGLSIDGPESIHDRFRMDRSGAPVFKRVMESLERLRRHEVAFNVLASVTSFSAKRALEIYRFLKNSGVQYVQFAPVVERVPNESEEQAGLKHGVPYNIDNADGHYEVTDYTVHPLEYGGFLTDIFDEWIAKDVGGVFVMNFEWALASWMKIPASCCLFTKRCGDAIVVERDGDVYACDHYVYPEYRLGNVLSGTLELIISDQRRGFGRDKEAQLPECCRKCDVLFACNGECPRNRFAKTPDGESGLNYLCEGYRRFFRHIDPHMRVMARLVENGQPAAKVMEWCGARG